MPYCVGVPMPTTAPSENSEWGGLTQYVVDGDDIQSVDAFRVDPEKFVANRVGLSEGDKVALRERDSDIPDRFGFVGTAENHKDVPDVWAVYATPDASEWGTVKLSVDADESAVRPAPDA